MVSFVKNTANKAALFVATAAIISSQFFGVSATQAIMRTTTAQIAAACKSGEVKLVSHRGETGKYSGYYHQENSIMAFRGAVERGAMELETDLRLTKDGKWMLLHDATLNRTTNGSGEIKYKTAAQVRALKLDGTRYQRVPYLDELLSNFAANPKVTFQLELKTSAATDAQLIEVLNNVDRYGLAGRVTYTSFSGKTIQRMKSLSPTIRTYLISSNRLNPATAHAYGANGIAAPISIASADYIDTMQREGLSVNTWGADSNSEYYATVRNGANLVTTDYTLRYKNWCDSIN